MQSEGHLPGKAFLIPVVLVALTATPVRARGQDVLSAWSLAAGPGDVSQSGAVTFGFTAALEEFGDLVGMMPAESRIPGLCRQLLDDMWRGSATFRRQWTRLAAARIGVTMVFGAPMLNSWTRAHAELSRTPDLRVRIWLPIVDRAAVEYLAHEIEHVLEALDEVDLALAVEQGVHGVTAAPGRPQVFETSRAVAIGRLVAREVTASHAAR